MSSQYFKTRFVYDHKREGVWRALTAYLQRFIPADGSVLEIGAGYCHFINNIKAKAKHCLDTFEELPRYAHQDVVTHVRSALDMDHFEDAKFDSVFCSNFLEHLTRSEAQTTIEGIFRILRHKGQLILIQPNYRYCAQFYFDDYTHQTIYTHVSLPQFLAGNGFDPKLVKPKFIPFSMNSKLPKMGWLVGAYLRSPLKPFAKQMLVVAQKN